MGGKGMGHIVIRKASKSDSSEIADLFVRLKRLNGEFDPLFVVVTDAKERAEEYINSTIGSKQTLLLAALKEEKVVGALRAELRERLFYEPGAEGYITEMYILPEYRRGDVGAELLERAMVELKSMGAEIIVADFPSRNEIAAQFYSKRDFRRLVESFVHVLQ
jgi:ribosomal protein S18 acetylase RimI-like enzyme